MSCRLRQKLVNGAPSRVGGIDNGGKAAMVRDNCRWQNLRALSSDGTAGAGDGDALLFLFMGAGRCGGYEMLMHERY